jgi:hypothetical protein
VLLGMIGARNWARLRPPFAPKTSTGNKKAGPAGGPAKAAGSTLEEVVPRGERPKTASTGRE